VGFVVDKVVLGHVSSKTTVSPANSHSTDSKFIIIYDLLAGTIGQLVADVPSGLILSPP
jgi:hypothetical protein